MLQVCCNLHQMQYIQANYRLFLVGEPVGNLRFPFCEDKTPPLASQRFASSKNILIQV